MSAQRRCAIPKAANNSETSDMTGEHGERSCYLNNRSAFGMPHVPLHGSSDVGARNAQPTERKAPAHVSTSACRSGDGLRMDNGSNVNFRPDETPVVNGNRSINAMMDNSSLTDDSLDTLPATHVGNNYAQQLTPSIFGNSTPSFPVPSGYGIDMNSLGFANYDAPMLFVPSPTSRTDHGNPMLHQPSVGYPNVPARSSQKPASRRELPPQVLLSLEAALDRFNGAEELKLIQEDNDNEPKADGAESSASNKKKTDNNRRKSNKGRGVSSRVFCVFGARHGFFSNNHAIQNRATPEISSEEKRRIRAERNRESAERSRLRSKERAEELERAVYNLRVENHNVKQDVDAYYAQMQLIVNVIEREMSKDEAKKTLPGLYNTLSIIQSAIEECKWTYRNPREPDIPLKIRNQQSDNGSRPGRSRS